MDPEQVRHFLIPRPHFYRAAWFLSASFIDSGTKVNYFFASG